MKNLVIKVDYENECIESDLVSVTVADDVNASNVCTWMLDAKADLDKDNDECDCGTTFMAEDVLDFLAEKELIKEWHYIEEDDTVTL